MKKLILFFFAAFFAMNLSAQTETVEELKAMQAEKSAAAAALQAEADGLQARIDAFPGWKFGGLGVLGFNMFDNNAWYSIRQAHSSQTSVGLGFTAFGNYDQDKMFWRNALTINMTKTDAKEYSALDPTETVADKLGLTSLAGYKLTDKIAISAEGLYTSSVLNFNNPGQLTMSLGATWLPITDLVVVVHPFGYQFNWPGDSFNSSAGAKIGATYTREVLPGVKWNSALTAFLAYGGGANLAIPTNPDYTMGEMSNWSWENGFAFTAWKGIGVGLNIGLAGNKQLVDAYRTFASDDGTDVYDPITDESKDNDNPLQMYYNAGLSYGF